MNRLISAVFGELSLIVKRTLSERAGLHVAIIMDGNGRRAQAPLAAAVAESGRRHRRFGGVAPAMEAES